MALQAPDYPRRRMHCVPANRVGLGIGFRGEHAGGVAVESYRELSPKEATRRGSANGCEPAWHGMPPVSGP